MQNNKQTGNGAHAMELTHKCNLNDYPQLPGALPLSQLPGPLLSEAVGRVAGQQHPGDGGPDTPRDGIRQLGFRTPAAQVSTAGVQMTPLFL